MPNTEKGTIEFLIGHEHSDWATNENTYNFGPFSAGGLEFKAFKHSDKSFQVGLIWGGKEMVVFQEPMPVVSSTGLHVAISWRFDGEIKLYLDADLVSSVPFPSSKS